MREGFGDGESILAILSVFGHMRTVCLVQEEAEQRKMTYVGPSQIVCLGQSVVFQSVLTKQ